MEPEVHGIYKDGHVELIDELDVPDGTEMIVRPAVAPHTDPGKIIHRGMFRGEGCWSSHCRPTVSMSLVSSVDDLLKAIRSDRRLVIDTDNKADVLCAVHWFN